MFVCVFVCVCVCWFHGAFYLELQIIKKIKPFFHTVIVAKVVNKGSNLITIFEIEISRDIWNELERRNS